MRHTPPESLVELLRQLGLASADDLRAAAGRARRLARGLPLFESVWIDALAQAGVLTAFQASEINARRGLHLRVGPYVLDRPLGSLQYADSYAAHAIDTCDGVLLAVQDVSAKSPQERDEILRRLEKLLALSATLDSSFGRLLPVVAADVDGRRAWAVCRADKDFSACQSAVEWIIHHGRFPPAAVLEIARAMTAALAELQQGGLPHGDIRAETLLLTASGRVLLPLPGLRVAFRPSESHTSADLPPQAYDGLAPERSARAAAANPCSDIFGCGCLWWHLLTARPALPGGNGLTKMRAAQTLDIPPLKPLAPDTPQELAAAIEACVARDPAARPQSPRQLADMLGTGARGGRRLLVRSLGNIRAVGQPPAAGSRRLCTLTAMAAAAALTLIAVAVWLTLPGDTTDQTVLDPSPAVTQNKPEKTTHAPPPSTAAKPITSTQPALDVQAGGKFTGSQPAPLLLDSGKTVDSASLRFSPGQTVSSKGPGRTRLLVPSGGLVVDVDNVRFENIDFCGQKASGDKMAAQSRAFVDLRSAGAIFQGCTFSSEQDSSESPAAIRWTHPLERSAAELALPSGSLRLANCVFTSVSAAIDCRTAAAVSIEAENVLHLGRGPLVRLDRVPRSDEPFSLSLSKTTLRDSGPLLQCACGPSGSKPARISIEATASVFMPAAETGLIRFVGRSSPRPLLEQIEWTGQGSLVGQNVPIAQWLDAPGPDAASETLDDTAMAMAGLVRGEVQFAAPATAGFAASQITHWQAPLQSNERPGVDVKLLPKK